MKARPLRLLGTVLLTLSLAVAAGVVGPASGTAWAVEYPSWNDVVAARGQVAQTKAMKAKLESAIAQLQREVDVAQQRADELGAVWAQAQQKLDSATYEADQLQLQADAAAAQAEESARRAAEFAAQLSRSGSGDMTLDLLFSGQDADNLLYRLGTINQLGKKSSETYEQATADRNAAQSLQDQAEVARQERVKLEDAARAAFDEAQQASIALQLKVAEQAENLGRMQYQLAALEQKVVATETGYKAGVIARIGTGAQLGAGYISNAGWARPVVGGYVASGFGGREHPIYGYWMAHAGVDIAASYNTPIYAAAGGTIAYAGPYGGYGNFVLIDHGNGITTAYGHIINGGILVQIGQEVVVGQQIAKMGSTGNSTGPHVHFETRVNGVAQDPEPFMASRGITLRQ